MDVQKIIYVAVPIIVLVIVVAAVMTVARTGKTTFTDANSKLTDSLGSMNTGSYDLYDGAEVNGGTVIDVINETWKDPNVEVCVSTANPAGAGAINIVYNYIDPTSAADWDSTKTGAKPVTDRGTELSGMPAKLANGVAGPTGATTDKDVWFPCTETANSNVDATAYAAGYSKNPNSSAKGYISNTMKFTGSVQKDGNGDVRRITFVQN